MSALKGLECNPKLARSLKGLIVTATYLDWNATGKLRPQAKAAMLSALEVTGNPSSVHSAGRTARLMVEAAREHVASVVAASARDVVFTASGTEANMLALTPALGEVLLVSAIEHPSVRSGGRFSAVQEIPVTADGMVDLGALERQLATSARSLVSIMLANNETGVVQPVAAAAALVHDAGGLLHVDAVQGPGRMACDFKGLGADLMTLSAHKIGGPQGVGALIRREGIPLPPVIKGGGQERGARAGTENVAGIAGFGAAAEAAGQALAEEASRMATLRDRFEAGLKALTPQAVFFGSAADRLPNTSLFTVPGMKAETAIIALDLEGIAVSSGAACSSGKVASSHVLAAMGVDPELSRGAIRVSFGYSSTDGDVEFILNAWAKLRERLYMSGKAHEIAA
jgi:cysteine desulfurase